MPNEPVELIVCGAAGRMGRRIIALSCETPGFRVSGAVEARGHAAIGKDAGETAGAGTLGVAIVGGLPTAIGPAAAGSAATAQRARAGATRDRRVIVDFTTAEASLEHLEAAAAAGMAIVVGSTGFSPQQRAEAESLSRAMPTLIAPNMSLGVNVLLSLVEDAVRRLGPEFDCEIFEVHHGRKKDSPSGTALALAEAAARASGLEPAAALRTSREGLVGERPKKEIGVFGLRGGDAAGDHTVMLIGAGERLELTHRAASRDCLAVGALKAAAWIIGKPPGLYSMRDVIAASA